MIEFLLPVTVLERTRGVVVQAHGARWYVLKHDETKRAIAADLRGDEERYRELFDLNVGQAGIGDGRACPAASRSHLASSSAAAAR